jgi:hypothetical protein
MATLRLQRPQSHHRLAIEPLEHDAGPGVRELSVEHLALGLGVSVLGNEDGDAVDAEFWAKAKPRSA